jgi:hypothetical protein
MMLTAATLDYWLKVVQLIGIPVGIGVYMINKRKERIAREYGTYDALDQKYIDYLTLCLANPDLDVADVPMASGVTLTAEQSHKQMIMFSILLAIMERAYIMYKDKSGSVRQAQWSGWDAYIKDWLKRENFAAAVPILSAEFDAGFVEYLGHLPKQAVTPPL